MLDPDRESIKMNNASAFCYGSPYGQSVLCSGH